LRYVEDPTRTCRQVPIEARVAAEPAIPPLRVSRTALPGASTRLWRPAFAESAIHPWRPPLAGPSIVLPPAESMKLARSVSPQRALAACSQVRVQVPASTPAYRAAAPLPAGSIAQQLEQASGAQPLVAAERAPAAKSAL
jgi:hypothetical protein